MNFFENGTYLKSSYFTIKCPFKYLCYPQISGGGKFSPVSWEFWDKDLEYFETLTTAESQLIVAEDHHDELFLIDE